MKKITVYTITILLSGALISSSACSKEKEGEDNQNADCKICKAYAAGNPQRKVCSEAEEIAFRNEYAGHEISCN